MRTWPLIAAIQLMCVLGTAQLPNPQVPVTGNLGAGGVFSLFPAGVLSVTDADHTLVYPETTAVFIQLTSASELTTTHKLVAPLAIGFKYTIQNFTSGNQTWVIGGATGATVTIPNGATVTAYANGSGYYSDNQTCTANCSFNGITNLQAVGMSGSDANLLYGGVYGGQASGVDNSTFSTWVYGVTPSIADRATTVHTYGSGGYQGTEHRSNEVYTDNSVFANIGIANVFQAFSHKFGTGDWLPINFIVYANAGVRHPSDQGVNGIFMQTGQQPNGGRLRATIAAVSGTGAQTMTLSGITGCNSPDQACTTSPGAALLDIATPAATGYFTAASVPFSGVCGAAWMNQLPTTGSLPTSSAYGCVSGVNLNPATAPDAPIPETFTLTAGSGTLAANTVTCVLGDQNYEQSLMTTVTGSAGTQTVTLPLAWPNHNVALFQGGICSTRLHMNADANIWGVATNYPTPGSIDGTNLVYAVEAYGNTHTATLPLSNTEPESVAGSSDPNAGFTLYWGTNITRNNQTAPYFNLEPNRVPWTVGNTVDNPDFTGQNIIGIEVDTTQNNPSLSNASNQGGRVSVGGMGAAGPASYGFSVNNTSPANRYDLSYGAGTPASGLVKPPYAAYGSNLGGGGGGPFQYALSFTNAPTTGFLNIVNWNTGQTTFGLFMKNDAPLATFGVVSHIFDFSTGTSDGIVKAPEYQGPAGAPTGACTTVGWAFSQDGHISFCNGTVWAIKI